MDTDPIEIVKFFAGMFLILFVLFALIGVGIIYSGGPCKVMCTQ